MARRQLDTAALARAVATITRHRNISMREAAAEMAISPSTLTRLAQGHKPDADNLLSLLAWLRSDAAEFTVPEPPYRGFPISARFVRPDGGWKADQETVAELGLVPGRAYTLDRVEVDRSSTRLYLHDFPDTYFNSVQFIAAYDDEEGCHD